MLASQATAHAALTTDAAGNILTWNDGCAQLFGRASAECLGQPLACLLNEDGRAGYQQRWPALPAQAEALELHIIGADGQPRLSTLTLVPQYGPDARVGGCVAHFSSAGERDETDMSIVGQTPLQSIVNVFAGTFYVLNREGRFVLWNENLERASGLSPAELQEAHALDMFAAEEKPLIAAKIRQVFEEGAEVLFEANYYSADGRATPYLMCGTRITCKGRHYLCGMGLDVSRRHEQEQQLRVRDRALHASSSGILVTRCEGRDNPIEYVNPAFERITGFAEAEAIGRDPRFMAVAGLDEDERATLREALRERRHCMVVFRNQRKDGDIFWNELAITPVPNELGRVTHFVGVINDVTSLKQRTVDLEYEINHDPLTGLANRNLMWDRLEQALHMAQRNKTLVAVVLVDLDSFKLVNDSLGHNAGDEVLKAVARRLQSSVRDSDTVARMSGDEFVLVLSNQPSLRFTLRMVERLRQNLSRPVSFDRSEIPVGASMGVSVFPHDGTGAFDLVRAADVAMYHAKGSGKDAVHFFSPEMRSTTEAKQRLEDGMRRALADDQFFLQLQPRWCLRSGRMAGLEALLRWRHPEQGVLLPEAFLGEAEENGMIVPIGARVLDKVCALLAELHRRGRESLVVSMNVSYREFSQHDFTLHLGERLRRLELAPARLELEMTEDHLLRNLPLSRELAVQLRELGVGLAVDHFGDGLSSLSYLHKMPIDHLKMSRAALRDIRPETRTGPMAKTLIDIAHNLDFGIVADGVETRGQADFLRANGCDQVQGSYFSAPTSLDALLAGASSLPT